VLLWINGPFGGGKTQATYEIQRRLPGSIICDPEQVGYGLHRMTPPLLRGDFQDLPAWRQGVYEVLDLALTRHDGTVIVPMTVVEPTYFRRASAGCGNAAMRSGTSRCWPIAEPYCDGCRVSGVGPSL
jgi:hypothetical protein